MTSAALRHRLHSLWTCLANPSMDQDLASENVVPSKFLANNNITLTMEHFSFSNTPAENRNKKPPILFLIRPESIITEHPIDLNGEFFRVAEEVGVDKDNPSPAYQMNKIFSDPEDNFYSRGGEVAHYTQDWSMDLYPPHMVARISPHSATFKPFRMLYISQRGNHTDMWLCFVIPF
ncbi:hypothetical protein BJX66DRAFT_51029 [Aspergillus keveii]|uniref:Uncharacterized protein n=1 Tax=Aspergillus keveii TaxID=714993 RepID=A0ABR4FRN5_9EURO